MGLLTEGAPCSVDVCGVDLSVNTDWRVWMTVWQVLDDPSPDPAEKALAVLALAFPHGEAREEAMRHPNDALEAAMDFLRRRDPSVPDRPPTRSERRLRGKRLFDWEYDASRIAADFQREYGIDLTDEATSMHWYRFMALFNGLGDRSQIVQAISIRAADLGDGRLGKEERSELRERKMAVMLPARTEEEAACNRRIRGV